MRNCWIAAGLASLSVAAWSAAVAQERQQQPDQNAPGVHRSEGGKEGERARGAAPGANSVGERAAPNAQAQTQAAPSRQEQRGESQTGNREPGAGAAEDEPSGAEKGRAATHEQQKGQGERSTVQGERSNGAAEKDRGTQQGNSATSATNVQQHTGHAQNSGESRNGQGTNGSARTNEAGTGQGGANASGVPASRMNEAATGGNHVDPNQVRATGSAHLTNDNAAKIANTLTATSSTQNINVSVNVGRPLPGDVDVRPLPPAVVDLVPEYRGYDYVVSNDEIVIVQPSTRKVVEVISEGGGPAPATEGTSTQAAAGTRVNPCGP